MNLLISNNDLGFDVVSILPGQLLLSCSRDKDVTLSLHNVTFIGLSVREADNGAMLLQGKNMKILVQHSVQSFTVNYSLNVFRQFAFHFSCGHS